MEAEGGACLELRSCVANHHHQECHAGQRRGTHEEHTEGGQEEEAAMTGQGCEHVKATLCPA